MRGSGARSLAPSADALDDVFTDAAATAATGPDRYFVVPGKCASCGASRVGVVLGNTFHCVDCLLRGEPNTGGSSALNGGGSEPRNRHALPSGGSESPLFNAMGSLLRSPWRFGTLAAWDGHGPFAVALFERVGHRPSAHGWSPLPLPSEWRRVRGAYVARRPGHLGLSPSPWRVAVAVPRGTLRLAHLGARPAIPVAHRRWPAGNCARWPIWASSTCLRSPCRLSPRRRRPTHMSFAAASSISSGAGPLPATPILCRFRAGSSSTGHPASGTKALSNAPRRCSSTRESS